MLRRGFYILIVTILFALSMGFSSTAFADDVSHDIENCTQLQAADAQEEYFDDTFNLTQNIYCDGYDFDPLDWGEDFFFSGTFNGNGHTIFDLTIDGGNYAGMIAHVGVASITDITFDSANVSGINLVGVVAGQTLGSVLSSVHVNNSTVNASSLGGGLLIGEAINTSVLQSNTSGSVEALFAAGGLLGYAHTDANASSDVLESWSTAQVQIADEVYHAGGLVGQLNAYSNGGGQAEFLIQDSYATGNVDGGSSSSVGGLVGSINADNSNSTNQAAVIIRRTYATGQVTGGTGVGGLVGSASDITNEYKWLSIQDSFSTGQVTGNDGESGGILGVDSQSEDTTEPLGLSNNYFDSVLTDQEDCVSNLDTSSEECSSDITEGQFIENDSNAPLDEWNFVDGPWKVRVDDYPSLTNDDDFDGIPSDIENDGFNDGDANDDDILDSRQSDIASFMNQSGTFQSITISGGTLTNVTPVSIDDTDEFEFPFGGARFEIQTTPGGVVLVGIKYYTEEASNGFDVMKYDSDTHEVIPVQEVEISDTVNGSDHWIDVFYPIVDGGVNDQDEDENGTIVDPVVLASLLPTAVTTTVPTPTTSIVPAPTSVASGNLPATGVASGIFGVAIILLGVGCLLAAKRRRRSMGMPENT